MNAISSIRPAANVSKAARTIVALKGRGKAQRELAYLNIAPLSFVENVSRVDTIANLRTALGTNPTDTETAAARNEWVIGRVAARLAKEEFPKACTSSADKLEFARKVVLDLAKPETKKLGAKVGRRSPLQQRAVAAASEAWSQIAAELAIGKAQTQAERNKRKRNAAPASGMGKAASTAKPTHAELVKPAKAVDADEATQYLMHVASTALLYANKNAKVLPTDYGAAVAAFKAAINKAANAYALRKAAKESAK